MSAAAETHGGRLRGLLLAGVALLAAAALFVVWRERRDGAGERIAERVASTSERRGADSLSLNAPSSTSSDVPAPDLGASTPAVDAGSPGLRTTTAPRNARACRGRFVFVDGEPGASVGFVVESRPSDDAPYVVVGRGLSKSDGSFSLQLFEAWQVGRPVRFAASPGERLNIDSSEHSLPSDAPLEVAVSGARVTLQVVDSRGAPAPNLKLCYRQLKVPDASAESALQFGTTDRDGRDYLDFLAPETIVVWAVDADEADCTDRVEIAAQHGVRANRVRLTAPGLPLTGGLRVTVVDELDRPLERAFVSLYRGRKYLPGFKKSDEAFVYEQLAPGEYTLEAQPSSTGAERNDAGPPPYLAAEMCVVVSDRVEDVRISLQRAAILVLDVVRTNESWGLGAYLRLPEELTARSRAADANRSLNRRLSWARFADATGVVWSERELFCGSFHQPGRYWCYAPPGRFEVVFEKAREWPACHPRGLVELESERETTLAVEF